MREEGGRRRTGTPSFSPVSYSDDYLRTTAERLNFIAYLASRERKPDFEAARFMHDLYRAAVKYFHERMKGA